MENNTIDNRYVPVEQYIDQELPDSSLIRAERLRDVLKYIYANTEGGGGGSPEIINAIIKQVFGGTNIPEVNDELGSPSILDHLKKGIKPKYITLPQGVTLSSYITGESSSNNLTITVGYNEVVYIKEYYKLDTNSNNYDAQKVYVLIKGPGKYGKPIGSGTLPLLRTDFEMMSDGLVVQGQGSSSVVKTVESVSPDARGNISLDKKVILWPKDNTEIIDEASYNLLPVVDGDSGETIFKNMGEIGKVDTVNGKSPDDNKNVNIGLNEVLQKGNTSDVDITIVGESSDTTITKTDITLNDVYHSTNLSGREGFSNYNEKGESSNLSLDKGLEINKQLLKTPPDDTGDYVYETIGKISNDGEILKKSEIVNERYQEPDWDYENKWSALKETYYGNSSLNFVSNDVNTDEDSINVLISAYQGFTQSYKVLNNIKYVQLNQYSLDFNENDNDTNTLSTSHLNSRSLSIKGLNSEDSPINSSALFGNPQYSSIYGEKPCAYFLEEDRTDLSNHQRIVMYNIDGIYSYSSQYGASEEYPQTNFHLEIPKVPTDNKDNYVVNFRLKSGTVALLSDLLELAGPVQIADILNFIDKIESQSKANSDYKVQNIRNSLSTNAGIGTVLDYIDGTYVDKKIEGTSITFEPLGKPSLGLTDNGNGNYDLDLAGVPIVIADSAYPDNKYFVKTKGNTNFTIEMQTLLITETLTGNGYVLSNYNSSLPDLEVQVLDYYALVGMIGFNPINKYMYRVNARVKTTHENVDAINNTQFISYVTPVNLKEVGLPSGTVIELAIVDTIMGRVGDYNTELTIP